MDERITENTDSGRPRISKLGERVLLIYALMAGGRPQTTRESYVIISRICGTTEEQIEAVHCELVEHGFLFPLI